MAITNTIAQIWSAKLIEKVRKQLIYAQSGVISRDYQSEVQGFGDRIHIHSFSDHTVNTYVPNTTTITYPELTDARVTLNVDQFKYGSFKVDDVNRVQMKPDAENTVTDRLLYQIGDVADQYIVSLRTQIAAANILANVTFTSSVAYDSLVDLSQKMDEGNLPAEGRFAVLPPWAAARLRKDSKFIQAQPATVLNGSVGRVAGINILVSNNVPMVTGTPNTWRVIAGVPAGWQFVDQINKIESIRLEGAFGDGIRALYVYGARVTYPELLFDQPLAQ